MQLRKLRSLLEAILPSNPFYARKLAACEPALAPGEPGGVSRAAFPITTRHELVRDRLANPPYGTNLTFPLEAYVRCHQTSGTTTVPIRWLDTAESWHHIVDNWLQILAAAGVTRRDRFFFAFSFGPFLGFWSALDAVHRLGCFCFPGGSMSSHARLQAILDNDITALCCTPTYAQHLGEVARDKEVDLTASRVAPGDRGGRGRRQHPRNARAHRTALARGAGLRPPRHDRGRPGHLPMPGQARRRCTSWNPLTCPRSLTPRPGSPCPRAKPANWS